MERVVDAGSRWNFQGMLTLLMGGQNHQRVAARWRKESARHEKS